MLTTWQTIDTVHILDIIYYYRSRAASLRAKSKSSDSLEYSFLCYCSFCSKPIYSSHLALGVSIPPFLHWLLLPFVSSFSSLLPLLLLPLSSNYANIKVTHGRLRESGKTNFADKIRTIISMPQAIKTRVFHSSFLPPSSLAFSPSIFIIFSYRRWSVSPSKAFKSVT